jgi:hypothetical protein
MARPTILTDAFTADFCSKLRVCGSIETAIKASGCGRESYYGWARDVRNGEGSEEARKFIAAVELAEGEVKLLREHKLSKHFDKNWQALAWWLERKYSHEYGQRHPAALADIDAVVEGIVDRVEWEISPAKAKAKLEAEQEAARAAAAEPPPDQEI